jgi:hypothetical protein
LKLRLRVPALRPRLSLNEDVATLNLRRNANEDFVALNHPGD